MTPEKKAKELVNRFAKVGLQTRSEGIECAKIHVDELIKSLRKTLPEIGLGKGYWYSVRKEIEIIKNE